MPIITKITQGKRNPERYNIFLDENFAYSVDETVLVRYQLTKGKELNQWTIEEMNFDDEIRKAFNKSLDFLSFRMRSEKEVRQKLKEKEFGNAIIDEAIKKLYKLNFLDDRAFSEALMRTQMRSSKKGPKAIQQDMQKKGIDKKVQKDVLASYSEEEQLEIAKGLAEKIADKEKMKTPMQIEQKITDTLLRKGYSYSLIKLAMADLELAKDEDQWTDIVAGQGDKLWRKYSNKLTGYDLKSKVKQGLYQKGFPAEVINDYLEKKETEDE